MRGRTPRQFTLDLPPRTRHGAEDFLVARPNHAAHALITAWPDWPDRIVLLVGDEGAGKSHLAAIWAADSGAVEAAGARGALDRAIGQDPVALLLDDADRESDETALFHLLNAVRESRSFLLLTARTTPIPSWPRLPDLASRLRALPVARLDLPDDATAKAVLVKLLDDRQLRVEADVVDFMAQRVDRSLAAVRAFVEALDRESLARGRAVGRRLAGDVLTRLQEDVD